MRWLIIEKNVRNYPLSGITPIYPSDGTNETEYYITDDTEEEIGFFYWWDKGSDRLTLLMR